MLSDLPAASRLRTKEPRIRQLIGDRATESGLTTQVLLLKSLESNGDRRNYLSSWEENVERRLAVVSEGPAETRRSRILDIQAIWSLDRSRTAAMSSPGFSALASVHASLSSHTQGSGCQLTTTCQPARLPLISECRAGKRVWPISCEQTGRQTVPLYGYRSKSNWIGLSACVLTYFFIISFLNVWLHVVFWIAAGRVLQTCDDRRKTF